MRKAFLIVSLSLLVLCGTVSAQDEDQNGFMPEGPGRANRGDLLRRELGLSPQQMRQIRLINRETRPKMQEAQEKYRVARRDLDEAIYADQLDEESLRSKVRAVIEAQGEISRLRAMSEIAVRKVLSPEQLGKFRDLRGRFAQGQAGDPARPGQRRRNMRNGPPPGNSRDKAPPPRR